MIDSESFCSSSNIVLSMSFCFFFLLFFFLRQCNARNELPFPPSQPPLGETVCGTHASAIIRERPRAHPSHHVSLPLMHTAHLRAVPSSHNRLPDFRQRGANSLRSRRRFVFGRPCPAGIHLSVNSVRRRTNKHRIRCGRFPTQTRQWHFVLQLDLNDRYRTI